MNFSVIIPLYNEEKNIEILNKELNTVLKKINNSKNHSFEIIYIDDGSIDNTYEVANSFRNTITTILIKNFKNLSQSKSILNGIENSNYNNIILMDGDLQNDPNDIEEMINHYSEKNRTIVHGFRKNRKDSYFTKILPSKIANSIVRFLTNSKIKDHGCSLKIFDKNLFEIENFFGDFHRLFAAQINQKYDIRQVPVNHRHRKYGKSNYGFERIVKIFIDIIFLKLIAQKKSHFYTLGIFGFFSFLLSIISFIYMISLKILIDKSFISTPLPVLVIFFALSGLIFFSICLILETIKKTSSEKEIKKKTYEIRKI